MEGNAEEVSDGMSDAVVEAPSTCGVDVELTNDEGALVMYDPVGCMA